MGVIPPVCRIPRVYMGWDEREELAYRTALQSIWSHGQIVQVMPLELERLLRTNVTRRRLKRTPSGRHWDHASGAPCSTEFANTRFLVPRLAQHGWAIFCDCDVVWLGSPGELLELADDRYAVMCVKHQDLAGRGLKMDGQAQLPYARKNWSSVILWNCDHPGHVRLTDDLVESAPGRDLHRFCWLSDSEIGELPAAWNWLVGVQPMPPDPKLAHFTLGGPWLPGWETAEHDHIWLSARQALGA